MASFLFSSAINGDWQQSWKYSALLRFILLCTEYLIKNISLVLTWIVTFCLVSCVNIPWGVEQQRDREREDTYSSSGTQGQMVHLLGEGTHHVSWLHGDGVVHGWRDHSTLWHTNTHCHGSNHVKKWGTIQQCIWTTLLAMSTVMLSTKNSFTHLIRSARLQLGSITGARRELFHFNKWNNAIQMRVMHTSAEMMHRPLNSRAARLHGRVYVSSTPGWEC